jgi:hypothetical protein
MLYAKQPTNSSRQVPLSKRITLSCSHLLCLPQDHNGDVIVDFPDVDPAGQLLTLTEGPWRKRLEESNTVVRSSLMRRQEFLGRPQHMWYSAEDAARALQYLLASADALCLNKPYRSNIYPSPCA